MEIKGKITKVLPIVTGEGKNGQWRKQDFILEYGEKYPKQVAISLFNDNIDKTTLNVGQEVTVSCDAESREYNDRYYTNITAWKIEVHSGQPVQNEYGFPY